MRRLAPLPVVAPLVVMALGCRVLGGRLLHPRPRGEEALPVKQIEEEIIVAAWAEPKTLPPGGGQAQILVRVQMRGGAPLPDVEVRLRTSEGSLYSNGQILATDGRGMTRDRLTTRKSAVVTLNAGGTRYRFRVNVGEAADR